MPLTTTTGAAVLKTGGKKKKEPVTVADQSYAGPTTHPHATHDGGTAGSGHPGGLGMVGKHPKSRT